ncbi:hypothetical protein VTN96DRAFT_6548 [Rasamsonia emersonii]
MRINVQSADTKALFGLFSHSRPMRSQALPSTTFRVTALRPGVRMDGSGESRAGFPVYAKHGGAGGMPVPQPLDKAGMACGRLPLNAPVLGGACHSMIPLASRFLAFSTLRIIPNPGRSSQQAQQLNAPLLAAACNLLVRWESSSNGSSLVFIFFSVPGFSLSWPPCFRTRPP